MFSKKHILLAVLALFCFSNAVAVNPTWNTIYDVYGVYAFDQTADVNLSLQVRSCATSNCSDTSFSGPDGTASTWFTTDFNNNNILWDLNVIPNNRYFQYTARFTRLSTSALLGSEDVNGIDYNVFASARLYDTNVTYNSAPLNVAFNIANNDLNSWTRATGLSSVTINDSNTSPGFSSLLNTALLAGGGCGCTGCIFYDSNNYCAIPFSLSSSTRGKITVSDINIQYGLTTLKGKLTTFKEGKPRSFSGSGEKITIRFDANRLSVAPAVTITDSAGTAKVSTASMTNRATGDLNSYDYNYSLNGADGWYDVTVGTQTFLKAFYQSPVWQSRYLSSDGNTFPFSIDVNVLEPNVSQRWFAPIDRAIDFNYLAMQSSIRVLDYNGTNYLEIPSQAYSATSSGNYISRANIVFLASLDLNESRQFFINYGAVDKNKTYTSDLNTTVTANYLFDLNNSYYRATVDTNQGGVITRISSLMGSTLDLNGYNPMQLSPELVINPTTYRASDMPNPTVSIQASGALVSKITFAWVFSPVIDYNISYLFYSKNPFFLVDTNAVALSAAVWSNYSDSYFFAAPSKFTKLAVNTAGTVSTFDVNAGNTSRTLGDINFLGLYNKTSFDALGEIFIQKSSSETISASTATADTSGNFYWKRSLYTGSVLAKDYFNTRSAIAIFNPWNEYSDLNSINNQLQNSLSTAIGSTATSDSVPPVNNSIDHTPSSDANDSADLNCYSTWTDDLLMNYVDTNITGPDLNIQASQTSTLTGMTASYLIPAAQLNAGTIICSFTAYDVAGNHTAATESFAVKDVSAPSVSYVNTPDTNALIDPGTDINVDANISEYSAAGISQVILYTRVYNDTNAVWNDWNAITMQNDANYSSYTYHYTASFTTTSGANSIWQYKIYTKDVNGYDANTEAVTLYSYWERTWQLTPASFGNKSGNYSTTIAVGDLNITNTGDEALDFTVTSNWDTKTAIYYNGTAESAAGYSFSLNPGDINTLAITVTAKTAERSDSLTITATPILGSPDQNTATAAIISTAGGPFMLIEWVDTNSSVIQGNTGVKYTARLTNAGNSDANTITMAWTIPSGFTLTTGSSSSALSTLAVNSVVTNTIIASVSNSASVGLKTVTFTAGCCSDSSRAQSSTTSVTINPKSTTTTVTVTPTVTVGGGGSNWGGRGSSGGGSSIIGKKDVLSTEEEKNAFFNTTSVIELVNGKTKQFTVKVTNPLSDATLLGLSIELSGLLSKYVTISPQEIPRLDANKTITITLHITAPKYFTKGTQDMNFVITGKAQTDNNELLNFREDRVLTLEIHDYSREETSQALKKGQATINDLRQEGYYVQNLAQDYSDAQNAFAKRDYETAMALANTIIGFRQKVIDANQAIAELETKIESAKKSGIATYQTSKLVLLAKLALQRGDIDSALASLKDATMTYALETKGEINIFVTLGQNWKLSLVVLAALIITFVLLRVNSKRNLLKIRIKNLKNEEGVIQSLIKDEQKKCFIDGSISLTAYADAIAQYEKRLSIVIRDTTRYENALKAMFSFMHPKNIIQSEKNHAQKDLKELQEEYLEKKTIDTRIYDIKQSILLERLSDLEKEFSQEGLVKSFRLNGRFGFFWRIIYREKR